MLRLVLLRHGWSEWNRDDLFTGWTDVELTPEGVSDARRAAAIMAESSVDIDVAFTSYQRQAIRTLDLVLDSLDRLWIPVHKHWRLNDRHYGALQGVNRTQAAAEHGVDTVLKWRRVWDAAPPPIEPDDPRSALNDPRYAGLGRAMLPRGESMRDATRRVAAFWHDGISPALRLGARVLVVAHPNSLRCLIQHLDQVAPEDMMMFEVPTGRPLVYELSPDLRPIRRYLLAEGGDQDPVTWPERNNTAVA